MEYFIGINDIKYPTICDDETFLTNIVFSLGKNIYNLSVIKIYKYDLYNIVSAMGTESETNKKSIVNIVVDKYTNLIQQGFVKTNDYLINFFNKKEIEKFYYSTLDENGKYISGYIYNFNKFDVDLQIKIIDKKTFCIDYKTICGLFANFVFSIHIK